MKGEKMKTFFTKITIAFFILFLTEAGWSQWFEVGTLNNLEYPNISVVDSNVVWIAGGYPYPVIYRTVNGGMNWSSIPLNGLPFGLSGIAAKDSVTAFVCDYAGKFNGGNSKVFKTTNAGVNWLLIDSTGGDSGFFNGLVFSKSNPMIGIAQSDSPLGVGTPYFILKTTNGGDNWFRQSPPGITNSYGLYYSIFVIDNSFYGFLVYNSNITRTYLTSNAGVNWILGNEGLNINVTGDLVFNDNKNTGILVTDALLPNVERTTNSGQNWNLINTNTNISGDCGSAWISGTITVFICAGQNTSNNTILRSDDGGLTWTAQNTSNVTALAEIDYARYNDKLVAYCVASDGTVVKTRQTVKPVGISQLSNEVPEKFSLKQNYPNPFNPATNLEFGISKLGFVSLTIYDILGKEVSKLVNEELTPGNYKVEFNGSELPSGIYFYRLEVNGLRDTKSMMLVK